MSSHPLLPLSAVAVNTVDEKGTIGEPPTYLFEVGRKYAKAILEHGYLSPAQSLISRQLVLLRSMERVIIRCAYEAAGSTWSLDLPLRRLVEVRNERNHHCHSEP